MPQKLLTLTIITFLSLQSFARGTCNIQDHYSDFIVVNKSHFNDKDYLTKYAVETTKKTCFSDLINNNIMFVDYLLTHFSSNANAQELLKITDSLELRKAYFLNLEKDSLFNSVMNEFVQKTLDGNPKDSVTFDNLLNIAVKYFSILKLSDEGYYVGKVCVGLNDIKKTESERKPFIEAFCFSSIMEHYQGTEFSMYDEFVKSLKELYKINLGIDPAEKLLRAQGALFFLMRNSEVLQNMLAKEFEENKEFLPFVLEVQ